MDHLKEEFKKEFGVTDLTHSDVLLWEVWKEIKGMRKDLSTHTREMREDLSSQMRSISSKMNYLLGLSAGILVILLWLMGVFT